MALLCLLAPLTLFGQECSDPFIQDFGEVGPGPVGASGYSTSEPGDYGQCKTSAAPQGRAWALLIYEIQYSTIMQQNRNPAQIEIHISVTANGQDLFRRREILQPAMFPGIDRQETTPAGSSTIYKPLRIEKVIPLANVTALSPTPLLLRVSARRLGTPPLTEDTAYVQVWFHPDIRFAMNETRFDFLPKDSSDRSIAGACTGATDQNCYPVYEAKVIYSKPEAEINRDAKPNGRIRFTLFEVSQLTGSSTNFGAAETPDYELQGPRQIPGLFTDVMSNRAVTRVLQRTEPLKATVTVSSLDYGGKAKLRAELLLGNDEPSIPAEIDASASGTPDGKPANAGCLC